MSLRADVDTARLSVLLDVRHPQAYLALGPTTELARGLGIPINWLPFHAQTLRPPGDATASDDRGARHRRFRAEAVAREIATYAEAQGLELRDYYRDGSPEGAHLAWLWVRDRHPDSLEAFLQSVFRGYWCGELGIDSPDALLPVLSRLACSPEAFEGWARSEGRDALASLEDELREQGLQQVPLFVVEEEIFWGRQHLPMIRWILDGRRGPGPI